MSGPMNKIAITDRDGRIIFQVWVSFIGSPRSSNASSIHVLLILFGFIIHDLRSSLFLPTSVERKRKYWKQFILLSIFHVLIILC